VGGFIKEMDEIILRERERERGEKGER